MRKVIYVTDRLFWVFQEMHNHLQCLRRMLWKSEHFQWEAALCAEIPCWCQRYQSRMSSLLQADGEETVTQITTEHKTRQLLKQMGYSSRRPQWLPLLAAKNNKQRLKFAQTDQHWIMEDCQNVAWTDESWFLHQHLGSRVKWHKHENMDDALHQ